MLFVFFDLKKCFDTINHDLLLSKLQKYGVEDNELLWFTDYLSDRSQAVNVDGCISSFSNINTGVPQGSVLGPLLFLIFINDLLTCLGNTLMNIYADDTAIHVCGTDFKNIQKRLQEEVDKVVQWFHSNRLVINNLKCCCMIISSHTNQHTLNIYIDDFKISQVDSTKYFDSTLNWREHVFNVKKKNSPKVGLIRKLKHIVPQDCLIKYYMATVQSQIDYCLSVWGYSSDANCKILQRLQNQAARIISDNFDWNVRGIDIVKDLGWLNVCQRRDYFTAITVYIAGLQPSYITDLFTLSRDNATRKTRSCCTIKLFSPKAYKSSFNALYNMLVLLSGIIYQTL